MLSFITISESTFLFIKNVFKIAVVLDSPIFFLKILQTFSTDWQRHIQNLVVKHLRWTLFMRIANGFSQKDSSLIFNKVLNTRLLELLKVKWVKVFKNGPSKICGRQTLINFIWSILEYLDLYQSWMGT